MEFWHNSGLSRRSSQVDPWRWNPENNLLGLPMAWPMRRKLGGTMYSNIGGASWVYTGPPPRPPPPPEHVAQTT
eukprot:1813383-Pyramimonas_sp.AAC.1